MLEDDQTQLFNDWPKNASLAERLRPQNIQEIVGQSHLLDSQSSFSQWLTNGGIGNVILYGPPGCGKTTLAKVIAQTLHKQLLTLNAVLSNLAELREYLHRAESSQGNAILFIDEIHRFNRSQQDALLPYCESGKIQLIGATTHNPSFYLIPALLSRSYLFELKALNAEAMQTVLQNALKNEKGLGALDIQVEPKALELIANATNGDLRRALNLLEFLCSSIPIGNTLTEAKVQGELKHWRNSYNAKESDHYDCISAFIKSVRGSDPDAAMYWLARMLENGEDPLYVARRLIILASEDIGLADSRGLTLASAAYNACEKIGMPECAIPLAHVTIFLALSPKSNSAYMAWNAAREFVQKGNLQAVPNYLQQTPIQREENYLYSHDYEANVSGQSYWDEKEQFYHLKKVGAEQNFSPLYEHRKTLRNQLRKKAR